MPKAKQNLIADLYLVFAFLPACFGGGSASERDWMAGCEPEDVPICYGSTLECELFDRANCERLQHELTEGECHHTLEWDENAAEAARELARELAEVQDIYHGGWDWQNVAINWSADGAMSGMMLGEDEPHCSAGVTSHHCNIMHCGASGLGIGAVEGEWDNSDGYVYYVMNFL